MMVDLTQGLTIAGVSAGTALTICLTIARLWVKDESRNAMKEQIDDLQKQIDNIESQKQCKEFCTLNHSAINTRFDGIESMLKSIYDLLLQRKD